MSVARMPREDVKWVGFDVAKDAIAVGVFDGSSETAPIGWRRSPTTRCRSGVWCRGWVSRARLRVCYEAGPTGYELHRLLTSMGVGCEVVAPSLVPVARGDRVKTDRRDARRLVRLYRAGELVTVRVPTRPRRAAGTCAVCEARRCRIAAGPVSVSSRSCCAAPRLSRRHDLDAQAPPVAAFAALRRAGRPATFAHLLAMVEERELRVGAIEADLAGFFERGSLRRPSRPPRRLSRYRPAERARIGLRGLRLAAIPAPAKFMGFVGWSPAEYSSGAST